MLVDAFVNDEIISAFLGIITKHEWDIDCITSFCYMQLENKTKDKKRPRKFCGQWQWQMEASSKASPPKKGRNYNHIN